MWEHRSSARFPASAEVLLYLKGLPVASGRVRNVSRDGMFVQMPGVTLGCNDYVELEMRVTREGDVRLPAMVVHGNACGIGLVVDRDDQRAAQVLVLLMEAGRACLH